MSNEMELLKIAIEEAREKLNHAVKRTGKIIDAYNESVELDRLIEIYMVKEAEARQARNEQLSMKKAAN